ncbi:DUF2231 domain-containing protein [Umezawaea sp. Da 62-37]|uniref:DUF2231 domain-containing protein n=1 Tax=Umezawaea sp. Da 62-37 TaxID=3075927 RepID=UPI0028F71F6A|nr:DUF2231 domain-containing protein [Umezawaea sp. Da 62-37]WNV84829.1 DUF2231 domain-containing protein [Umezawaea sp. Da 62-37]
MNTVNGLPTHILLVHAIIVLLPLSALLLMLSALWPVLRRRLAGPNAILSLVVLALVPVTTDAGEWLEHRVQFSALIRTHTELGDTALFVAIPVALLALVIWWRGRESSTIRTEDTQTGAPATQRTFLAPSSAAVGAVIAVLSILAAGAAVYDIYLTGDSGAQATWQGGFSQTPVQGDR